MLLVRYGILFKTNVSIFNKRWENEKKVRSNINCSRIPINIYQIFDKYVYLKRRKYICSICKLRVNVIYIDVNLFGERIILIRSA